MNSDYKSALINKLIIWLGTFLVMILFFALFRLLFLITHSSLINDSSALELLNAFWLGFRFDAKILSVIILPLYLFSLIPIFDFSRKFTKRLFSIILTLIMMPVVFISIADIRFFDVFGNRMNFWAVEFMGDTALFIHTLTSDPSSWKLVSVWIVLSVLFYLTIKLLYKKLADKNIQFSTAVNTVLTILFIALLAFGIRGRLGMKALDWGAAFFTENQFVNQLALNSVYTLGHSIYEEWRDGRSISDPEKRRFYFYDIDTAYSTVCNMLNIQPDSTKASYLPVKTIKPDSNLDFSPNIVIFIMESWSADKIGALGSKYNISPYFDSLAEHGILFTNFYANGIRTNRGLPAITCSFPSLPGRSIMKRYAADHPFISVAEILDRYGYKSSFAYGGDIEFDNMKGFLRLHGYSEFYDENSFPDAPKLGRWGIADHAMFTSLADEISTLSRPFQMTVLSISNHDPYDIPDDRFKKYDDSNEQNRMLNAFYYTDWALGQFFDSLKQHPVFDSTIFVITSDHCAHQTPKYPMSPETFHIPCLIYAPGMLGDTGIVIDKTASQVDILPTIVDLLGLETVQSSWGRDILSLDSTDPGFAVIVNGKKLGLIEDSLFLFHWINAQKSLYNINDMPYLGNDLTDSLPEIAEDMERRLNSYIQLANFLSRGGVKITETQP